MVYCDSYIFLNESERILEIEHITTLNVIAIHDRSFNKTSRIIGNFFLILNRKILLVENDRFLTFTLT